MMHHQDPWITQRNTRLANQARGSFRDSHRHCHTIGYADSPHLLADEETCDYQPAFYAIQPAGPSAVRVLTLIDPALTQRMGHERRGAIFARARYRLRTPDDAADLYGRVRRAEYAKADALLPAPCTC